MIALRWAAWAILWPFHFVLATVALVLRGLVIGMTWFATGIWVRHVLFPVKRIMRRIAGAPTWEADDMRLGIAPPAGAHVGGLSGECVVGAYAAYQAAPPAVLEMMERVTQDARRLIAERDEPLTVAEVLEMDLSIRIGIAQVIMQHDIGALADDLARASDDSAPSG